VKRKLTKQTFTSRAANTEQCTVGTSAQTAV